MTARLTAAQQRTLDQVRAEGVVVFNGRARRVVDALVDAGLVSADFDFDPQAKGTSFDIVQRITVRPVDVWPTWHRIDAGRFESAEQRDGTPDFIATRERGGWALKARTTQHAVTGFSRIADVQAYVASEWGGTR